ncbi:MAG: hypothetical protein QXD60_04240 [Nanopusillaceae archaeon]
MVNKKEVKKIVKNNNFMIFLIVLFIIFISYLIFLLENQKNNYFTYIILKCDENNLEEYVYLSNSTLFLRLITNCCGTDFKIYKINRNIFIEEIETGSLCKCICSRNIIIFPFKKDYNSLNILKRDCKYSLENFEKDYYKLNELNKTC